MADHTSSPPIYTLGTPRRNVPVDVFVQECVDIPKFLTYCSQCDKHGRRWSCPPYRFDPMKLWRQFEHLWLFAYILIPESGADVSALVGGLLLREEPA